MIDDETIVMPYSGTYLFEVAKVLENVVPSVPPAQRGVVARSILDALHNAGMLSDSPLLTRVNDLRRRVIAAEQQRDKAISRAALAEHTRSWLHVRTQLELDQALKVVRRAEAWREALPPDDPDAHASAHNNLIDAVDTWLEFAYDPEPDLDVDMPVEPQPALTEEEATEPVADVEPESAVES